MLTPLSQNLLDWYAKSARRLPWRGRSDPYAVWVSEIMLQQTQVETVIPYFNRWMAQFPTLSILAAAPEQTVLKAWEGLGYYSRARNLHRTARMVVEKFNGSLPSTFTELRMLPGIGDYTAAAIASIAFNQDEAALDGNIRRVFARLYAVKQPARSKEGEAAILSHARQNLPPGKAGDYNQALMDLGATVCLPRTPRCLLCPLQAHCQALQQGIQEQLPISAPRPHVPHFIVTAAVMLREDTVLLAQRRADGLLGGLWEFPGGKVEPGETLPECLIREIREELGVEIEVGAEIGTYRHAYTHFKVTLHAFCCNLQAGEPAALQAADVRWVPLTELLTFPMGKIDRQISLRLLQEISTGASRDEA